MEIDLLAIFLQIVIGHPLAVNGIALHIRNLFHPAGIAKLLGKRAIRRNIGFHVPYRIAKCICIILYGILRDRSLYPCRAGNRQDCQDEGRRQ